MFISTQSPGVCTCVASLCRGVRGTVIVPLILLTCTGCWQVLCKVSSFYLSQFITIQVQEGDKAKCRLLFPSPPFFRTHTVSFTHTDSFVLSPPLVLCVLWCFIWYPTIKPPFELPSIVYGFFLWGETESCLKGLQSRRLPSYWCRGVLPSSLLDQSLTSLLFYGQGHFTERSLTTSPQRLAKRYSSDSWAGAEGAWGRLFGGETVWIQIRNYQALAFAHLFTLFLCRSCWRSLKSRRKH